MAASKLKDFYVMGKIVVEVNLPIRATSLKDAMESALEVLEIDDFADIKGEVNNSTLTINGVFAA